MNNIAYYGSHNATIAVEQDGRIITVVEVERFLGYKNAGTAQYKVIKHKNIGSIKRVIDSILQHIKQVHGILEYDKCFYMNTDVVMDGVMHRTHEMIPAKEYVSCNHHESHANGAFYQSPFREALIVSFDGGGNDGKFNIYKGNRDTKEITLLERVGNPVLTTPKTWVDFDLGFAYMSFGEVLGDITLEGISDGNLVYPGKIMGLASYGTIKPEWVSAVMDYYKSDPQGPDYQFKLQRLSERIDLPFSAENRVFGANAYNLAATSQYVFECCFYETVMKHFRAYPNHPVCITGGCGLNILLNTSVSKYRRVFVGPVPNDCGLAVGMLLGNIKPDEPIDVTYSGIPLLDVNMLDYYDQNSSWWMDTLNIDKLVEDLKNGLIVGVARGNSEHGARALGNRSILCNPFGKGMKDILNQKVKNREWYRPFAPVVRLEDVNKYFEWDSSSQWMSFCPKVREDYRVSLGAITHVDNTARVQTVTAEQNPWLYELLTKFEQATGTGVLLNTSFNVNKHPILSSVKEAIDVFEKTQMDGLVIENNYIKKKYEQ